MSGHRRFLPAILTCEKCKIHVRTMLDTGQLFDVLRGLRSSLLSGSALGRDKGNLIAVAQGSSEGNISFVIEETAVKQALITAYREFVMDSLQV